MSSTSLNTSGTTRQKNPASAKCKVCEDAALYSFFGAVVCRCCKMFFRRNAHKDQSALKCPYNGHCEINRNTRHTCSSCRLKKCFDVGMKTEMIRAQLTKSKEKTNTNALVSLTRKNRVEQFPTLNLLERDHSILNNDQWTLISNISNCYDEYSGIKICENYTREKDNLPFKVRFKGTALIELYHTLLNSVQSLYTNNRDFLTLSADDRTLLVSNTYVHVGSVSSNFILRTVGISDSSSYYDTLETLSNSRIVEFTKNCAKRVQFDIIVMKIFLSIVSFSTMNVTLYFNALPVNLSNIKQVLRIQHEYTEILWKYLVYKYDYRQAVICVSDLVRCIFTMYKGFLVSHDIEWFSDVVDSVTKQAEENLNITA